jgi:threonine aldolase
MRVDLRSDTLTRPTAGMRAAMADAEVGDDVYGEDPSVNALEERVAQMFGHEAALFVPTGTMGNQVALRLHAGPGSEVVLDSDAHIVTYEGAGAASHGGIQTRTLESSRGILDPNAVARTIRTGQFGEVPTAAVAVENTHNRGGGAIYPAEVLLELRDIASGAGAALHCDGARIWNAGIATGQAWAEVGALFDSLSVCLSKGLGAPVGSVVVSSAEAIQRARVVRRRLGGGMRQAGVLAAAGIYALDHHLARLEDDHMRARRLSDAFTQAVPDALVYDDVQTNMVVLDVPDSREFAEKAKASDVWVGVVAPRRVRLLTHLDVDDDMVEHAIEVLTPMLRER